MKPGDNIKTTQHWLDYNFGNVKPYTGVYIGPGKTRSCIRVKRDGVKAIEKWHRDFWRKD